MYAQNERKCHFLKKLGLLLLLFALLTTAARAAVVARGQEYSAAEAGSVAGYEEGRRLAEHTVSTMTQLWDKVSSKAGEGYIAGTDIMANDDTTTLSVGEYKCSDGTCADDRPNTEAPDSDSMLVTEGLYGTIQCVNDDASCVLDGESSRRGIRVFGVLYMKLTIRAIRFYKGKADDGGGICVSTHTSKVDIILCVFDSCEATRQGGGIFVVDCTANIYATTFTGNSAPSGAVGVDIFNNSGGAVTIHETCPSPYSAYTPKRGKYENSIHHTALI